MTEYKRILTDSIILVNYSFTKVWHFSYCHQRYEDSLSLVLLPHEHLLRQQHHSLTINLTASQTCASPDFLDMLSFTQTSVTCYDLLSHQKSATPTMSRPIMCSGHYGGEVPLHVVAVTSHRLRGVAYRKPYVKRSGLLGDVSGMTARCISEFMTRQAEVSRYTTVISMHSSKD